jgi:peptide/nickel transport system ATP-binding protein
MILKVSGLVKSFGKVKAVSKVSFSLQEGENLCIIGESGCGKSTLAKMIMRLQKPDKGKIEVDPKSIQMVFQDPYSSLDPLWSIRSILKEAFCCQKLSSKEEDKRMKATLKAVGLSSEMLNRFPHEFSGGERQRIAIARALLTNPKILILDEAVSSLDVLVQKQIMDLLGDIKREYRLTYLFISHNLRVVRKFGDRILVMHQGKIVESGSTEEIFSQPQQSYTQQLMKAAFDYQV